MKVAVSSEGNMLSSKVDSRFGRARYFIIVDTKTMEYEALENFAASQSGGAGTKAAQMLIDKGIDALISSNVGPNAMGLFNVAKIPVYKASDVDVKSAVEQFNRGMLEIISEPTNKGYHGEY